MYELATFGETVKNWL